MKDGGLVSVDDQLRDLQDEDIVSTRDKYKRGVWSLTFHSSYELSIPHKHKTSYAHPCQHLSPFHV